MTTATAVDWTALNEMAQKVGKNVARQWPGIDPEDCAQEALSALLGRQDILDAHGSNEGLLYGFMSRVATRYASGERYEYTMRTAQYAYTPREVRGLLSNAFWDESLRETDVPAGPDTKTQLLAWENVCIALWDLDAAFGRLSPDDRFRLERRYRDGIEFPTDAARKAADRAIDSLTMYVNLRVNRADGEG